MPVSTHTYGEHPHQFAELHLPDGTGAGGEPLPVAVVVHGGFWMTANGGVDRMTALCADLTARGWAAWNVEYRRLGGGGDGGWPQTAQDVSAAVDHLATLDAPLDLTRVVSIGHSAGGHLTLLDAARTDATVRVAGTVAQAPLTDVRLAHDLGAGIEIIEAFMGGDPQTHAAAYAEASPVRRVPLGVPQLVVQGEADELVPPAMVVDYVAAARAAGDDVTFELRPGEGHFDHLDPAGPAWAVAAAWLGSRFAAPVG
jgi:acetyl esterase/lipase